MLARVIAVLALVMVWGGAHASAAWVDDSIYVPIRAAANPSGRILHRGIKSGTRIDTPVQNASGYQKRHPD